jgi:hypothetical protein
MRATSRSLPFAGRRPSQPFPIHAKHFQILGRFLQVFPKIPLAVLWKSKACKAKKEFPISSKFFAPIPIRKRLRRRRTDVAGSDKGKRRMFFDFQKQKVTIEKPSGVHCPGRRAPKPSPNSRTPQWRDLPFIALVVKI